MATDGISVLEARGVEVGYARTEGRIDVLRGAELTIPNVSSVAITGASGSGKSTALAVFCGMRLPDRGSVKVGGIELTTLNEEGRAKTRLQSIGQVFQDFRLLPTLTAEQNVALPARLAGRAKGEALELAGDLLDRVGLGDRRNHRPRELSGGEQQRVGVARALVNRPALVLADEPTASVDDDLADAIIDLLLDVTQESALVIVTHDRSVAARAQTQVRLHKGVFVPFGQD